MVKGGDRLKIYERLKNKEEAALRELIDEYGSNLLRVAILLVKDHHVAEEVVQDTFVTAFEKIEQLHDQKKLKSWLITITTNQCRRRMRTWSWKHIFLHKETEHEENIIAADIELQPEQALLKNLHNKQLYKSIQQLPYKYREVVTLYYFQQLAIKEIAETINEKENTVKTRLTRGRGLLKQLIEKGGEDFA